MNTGTTANPPNVAVPSWRRAARALRSVAALGVFLVYLTLFVGLVQRVVIFPLVWLLPGRRTRILGRWIRLAARGTRAIVTTIAGVRIRVTGVPIEGACVAIMNHQSVLDVMIVLCEFGDPPALIPVRTRYQWGIPGISPFIRAARYPFITQRRATVRTDLGAVAAASARAATGEVSLAFFPEGHRTRTGEIGPFMPRGLQVALHAGHQPVYCIVGDGMWQVRTLADSLVRLAGTQVAVHVSGPFMPPADDADIPGFIRWLRQHMESELRTLRSGPQPAMHSPGSVAD